MSALLEIDALRTQLPTPRGTVRAVDGASIEVRAGEAVAIVGESGCGKTMTALSIMRLVPEPGRVVGGRVAFGGRDLLALDDGGMRDVRGASIGMVFQDPMTFLHPLLRVGEQIAEVLRQHEGLEHDAARERAIETLALVRVPAPERIVDAYPHQLSGGMRQRVLIAIAISCRPRLLVADEPTTALDVTTQAQIMQLLAELRRELGCALLLITHDLGLVAEYCDRVYVMYAGQVVEAGDVVSLFQTPRHPYTAALLRSVLAADRSHEAFATIPGQPPSLIEPPRGCRFHLRCAHAMARCRDEPPPMLATDGDGQARCWLHTPQQTGGGGR